jgi:hypothetical protein
MNGYWMTFEDGTSGYCEGLYESDAILIASHIKRKKVVNSALLPYPAKPVIWQFDHPVMGKCPAFCYDPNNCAGRGSCPKPYACSG